MRSDVYLWELIFIDVNIDWAEGVAELKHTTTRLTRGKHTVGGVTGDGTIDANVSNHAQCYFTICLCTLFAKLWSVIVIVYKS